MTLELHAPAARSAELDWVADVVLERWLGLPVRRVTRPGPEVELHLPGGGVLTWPDLFLGPSDAQWLSAATVPAAPAQAWTLPDADLAARIGQPALASWFVDGPFERRPGRMRLPLDLSGSLFFMLSRYEEAAEGAARDHHQRPVGAASLAHRDGLALRPLVDEWVELLWWALQQLAPGLQRRPRQASTWISCDVDAPFSPDLRRPLAALRQAGAQLLGERRPGRAARTLAHALLAPCGVRGTDPHDTFDWMLDANERAGHRVSFFFIAAERPARIDGLHELDDAPVAALLRRVLQRGHEAGLHGSYGSVMQPERLAREHERLRRAIVRAGGADGPIGARQHYLRWRPDDTPRRLAALGLGYDSTLAFPDVAGFRCGTSHPYPLFDLQQRRPLPLLERPLVLMEATVMSRSYLALGHGEAAHRLMHGLRASCHRFGGCFSLLWHNSSFYERGARELYLSLLAPS